MTTRTTKSPHEVVNVVIVVRSLDRGRADSTHFREERGLSQQALADRVGLEQTAISKIELAEKRADILELRDICAALGVSLEESVRRLAERLEGTP